MNRNDAYEKMVEGKNITHPTLSQGVYCTLNGNKFVCSDNSIEMSAAMLHDDDYLIYNVKKKIIKWLNVYLDNSTSIHPSKEDADQTILNRSACLRYEIEFEEGEGL